MYIFSYAGPELDMASVSGLWLLAVNGEQASCMFMVIALLVGNA
jgi:hypothetical protein